MNNENKVDLDLLSKMAKKLEGNLKIINDALGFADRLTREDLTSKDGYTSAISTFHGDDYHSSPVKNALKSYLVFDKDESKLKAFISESLEGLSGVDVKTRVGDYDVISMLRWGNSRPAVGEFNPEADRIFKEIDAQLGLLCKLLSMKRPNEPSEPNRHPSSEHWTRSDVIEAGNILNAAKSIIE